MIHKFRITIYRYRRLIFAVGILLVLGFFTWLIIRPSTMELATQELDEALSYGEIKWLWQQYENDLADNPEWQGLIKQKLSKLSLNKNQKSDLVKWYQVKQKTDPVVSSTLPDKSKEPLKPAVFKNTEKLAKLEKVEDNKEPVNKASSIDLARLYNKQGDEKCKAFKAAKTPQLYHIANEYYEYAASLTNTNPKVCE